MNREGLNSECLSIVINNSYNEKGRVNLAYVRYEGVIDKLIDLIQRNTESKDEWVSVEDRLPEVKVKVDLFLTDGRIVCNYEIKEREQKLFWYFTGLIEIYKNSVTHWMPIPQPPKQGSQS